MLIADPNQGKKFLTASMNPLNCTKDEQLQSSLELSSGGLNEINEVKRHDMHKVFSETLKKASLNTVPQAVVSATWTVLKEELAKGNLSNQMQSLLNRLKSDQFISLVLSNLTSNTVDALKKKFVLNLHQFDQLLVNIESSKMVAILRQIPPASLEKLLATLFSVIPGRISHFLHDAISSHLVLQTDLLPTLTGCCQKKEINPVDFDELGLKHMSEEDRLEEIEYQRQHGHKPDKIVEPDTRLFEDFWHAGDASSNRVNTLPHSKLLGCRGQIVGIPDSPYFATFVYDCGPRIVNRAAIVDSDTAEVVNRIDNCYLLFPDNGRLVTLRLTSLPSKDKSDPNKVDGEKQLYREVVIYDITKLPDLVVLEQYVIDEPISDDNASQIMHHYKFACMAKHQIVKLVYGDYRLCFRAIVIIDGRYKDVEVKQKGNISMTSIHRCAYLADYSKRLAIVEVGGCKFTDCVLDISFEDKPMIEVTSVRVIDFRDLIGIEKRVEWAHQHYDCKARDAWAMANLKKPLPIFHKSKIYEIDLDYDKPLVEPTAGDQVSAGSKPGDKKDDNVKDKKKDESDDDDEESDSDGKKKKEEEQRSPLKLIIDLNEDIHSMSSSGDYIVLLTTNNYNTKQLTVLKQSSSGYQNLITIAKLQVAAYNSICLANTTLVLHSKTKITVSTGFELKTNHSDFVRLDLTSSRRALTTRFGTDQRNRPAATADKYGYLQDNIIYVRRISDNEILYQFDTRKIAAAYDMESVPLISILFNRKMTHVLVFWKNIGDIYYYQMSNGENYWLYGVDLQKGTFHKFDLQIDSYFVDPTKTGHVGISARKSQTMWYFEGEKLLACTGFPEDHHPFDRCNENRLKCGHQEAILEYRRIDEFTWVLMHESLVVDCGNHLKDAKVCRQARDSHIVAVHTGEEIYVYNLRKKNKPDKKKDPNDKTPVQKYTPRKYVFPGLASACIDSTGVLAYAVDNRGKLARLLLSQKDDTYGPNYEAVTVHHGIGMEGQYIQLNKDASCLCASSRANYSSPMQCLVFSVSQNRLLYTCHDVEGFPHNAYPLRAEFDDTTFKMVGQKEILFKDKFEPVVHTSIGWKDNSLSNKTLTNNTKLHLMNKNSTWRLHLMNYANTENPDDKQLAKDILLTHMNDSRPLELALNKGVFVLLAYLQDEDLLQAFVKKASIRLLVQYTRVHEWLFSNGDNARWVRKLVVGRFADLAVFNEGDVDAFDYQVFDKLVMYRYTPRLMKEPYARGIFLNLMRVPIKETQQTKEIPLEIDADLDEDNDTGLALKIGGRGFMKGHTLQKELKDFKRRLQQLKGKNLVPYEAFISAAPLQLTIGDIKHTELFLLIDACTDEELVDYLRPLIYLQWNKMYWIALLYMCVYWAYAAVCYAFYGFLYQSYALGAVLIGMSSLFLAFESLTLKNLGFGLYTRSGWNLIDLIAFVGGIVMTPLLWHFNVQTPGWAVGRCVMMTVVWLRALTWLRVFKSVRYLITMVLRVFYDMIAYVVILTGSVLGLTFIWRLSSYFSPEADSTIEERETDLIIPDFFTSLQVVTQIMLGNMPSEEPDGTKFSTVKFLVAVTIGIVLALALTNLLIAIINQTYNEIEERKKVHDLREVIGLIIDFNGSVTNLLNCSLCRHRRYVLSLARKYKEGDDPKLVEVTLSDPATDRTDRRTKERHRERILQDRDQY
jgi:hypothetical protein